MQNNCNHILGFIEALIEDETSGLIYIDNRNDVGFLLHGEDNTVKITTFTYCPLCGVSVGPIIEAVKAEE